MATTGKRGRMNKEYLLEELKKLSGELTRDYEYTHIKADDLLLKYINDKEITKAFENVGRWYA